MNTAMRMGVLFAIVAFASAIPPDWGKENFVLKCMNTFMNCAKEQKTNLKQCISLYKEEKQNSDEFKPCLAIGTCVAKKSEVYDENGNLQWDQVDKIIEIMPSKYIDECKKLKDTCKDQVSGTGDEMTQSGMNCVLNNSEVAKEMVNSFIKKIEKDNK